MIIDLNAMEWKENPGFKGGEGAFLNKLYDDGRNKMMKGLLKAGSSIGYHKHEGSCEIIFIIEGTGKLIDDGEEFEVRKGQVLYCPEGHSHSLISTTEDIVFYSAVPAN